MWSEKKNYFGFSTQLAVAHSWFHPWKSKKERRDVPVFPELFDVKRLAASRNRNLFRMLLVTLNVDAFRTRISINMLVLHVYLPTSLCAASITTWPI